MIARTAIVLVIATTTGVTLSQEGSAPPRSGSVGTISLPSDTQTHFRRSAADQRLKLTLDAPPTREVPPLTQRKKIMSGS